MAIGNLFVRLGLQSASYEQGIKQASSATTKFATTAKTQLSALQAQFAYLAGAAGIGMLAKSIVTVGARFERSMNIVAGVMRASEEEFKKLTEIARKMGETTEWSATESADALKFLGMAGFEATKAIAALPGVLDLATAGNIGLGRSADIATNALTAMGMDVGELTRINDVFIGTITRTNTDMEMMAESFKYAAPLAKAYGYDVEQLSAMIGILGNAGIQGSMAGTQLAFAIQQSARAAKELGSRSNDLIQILKEVNEAGWDNNKIMQVFGIRSGRAVLVLKDLIPEIKKLEDQLHKAGGESKKLADRMRSDVQGAFKELWSVIESLGIDIYAVFRDDIKAATKEGTKSIKAFKIIAVGSFEVIQLGIETLKMAFTGWDLILNPWVTAIENAYQKVKKFFEKEQTGGVIRVKQPQGGWPTITPKPSKDITTPLEELRLPEETIKALEAENEAIEEGLQEQWEMREIDKTRRLDQLAETLAEEENYIIEALIRQGEIEFEIKEAARLKEHEALVAALESENTYIELGLQEQWNLWRDNEEKKKKLIKEASLDMLNNWAYAFKELGQQSQTAFEMFKAFAIAETIIKTYEAAQASYAALAGIPIIGPALGIAAAAAAIAAGMARVAQIQATEPGTGTVAGGAGGAAIGTYAASPVTGLAETEDIEERKSLTINVYGDILGDEGTIQMIADKLSNAVENYDIRLISSGTK